MDDLISRQALLRQIEIDSEGTLGSYGDNWQFINTIRRMPTVDRPRGEWLPFEDIAQMMSNLFGECACDVNGNDEWLPQACKYAETECPNPKEKNGCWMQFLIQGGADMRGE